MIEFVILYLVVGLFVSMVVFGDSLGAFPLWIWPIWPLMVVVFVAGEAWFAIQDSRNTP